MLQNVVLQHDKIFEIFHSYRSLLDRLKSLGITLDLLQTTGKFSLNCDEILISDIEMETVVNGNKLGMSLQLCFDKIEPVNPIGSRTTIHKLGCFY